MMYSMASIEMACNPTDVNNPNLFLIAFMHAVATLDLIKRGVKVNTKLFAQCWSFYREVVVKNKLKDDELKKLVHQLIEREESKIKGTSTDGGEDFTDSDEVEKVGAT